MGDHPKHIRKLIELQGAGGHAPMIFHINVMEYCAHLECYVLAPSGENWLCPKAVSCRGAGVAYSRFESFAEPLAMLRASATLSSVLVRTVEGCYASLQRRAAGSAIKPIKDKGTPTIEEGRQAFEGDLRSTSGLGVADGFAHHTPKWLQVCETALFSLAVFLGWCSAVPEILQHHYTHVL